MLITTVTIFVSNKNNKTNYIICKSNQCSSFTIWKEKNMMNFFQNVKSKLIFFLLPLFDIFSVVSKTVIGIALKRDSVLTRILVSEFEIQKYKISFSDLNTFICAKKTQLTFKNLCFLLKQITIPMKMSTWQNVAKDLMSCI